MGQNTKIEWADATFNPWMGCTKVSEGCKFCYAENLMDSRWGKVKWGPNGTRVRTSESNWHAPIAWNKTAQRNGERRRVFCASLADVFEDRPELVPWRRDLFDMIVRTPYLDWLLLTKRPENALRMMVEAGLYAAENPNLPCPQPNVWIGTSVENQEAADLRIPQLLNVPAVVRFLSCEPLLGPVKFQQWWMAGWHGPGWIDGDAPVNAPHGKIAWVIVGGESGPNARPMHPDWTKGLRDQCVSAGVPFHYKQWGEWLPISELREEEYSKFYVPNKVAGWGQRQCDVDEVYGQRCTVKTATIRFDGEYGPSLDYTSIDGHLAYMTFRVGKKAAGRKLDGCEWDELPALPKSPESILK